MKQIIFFSVIIMFTAAINNKGDFKILKNREKLEEKCADSDKKYYVEDLGGNKILNAHHYAFGFWMRKGGSF